MSKLQQLSKISNYVKSNNSNSFIGKVILGGSLLSFAFGISSLYYAHQASEQIEFRKRQLKLPVYKLTQQQMVNPPWNHDNINTWLYRRVVGRPIIRQGMDISHWEMNTFGYQNVVPLVTREDQNHQNRHGLLLSLGFVPHRVKEPTSRFRIQRVDRQKFIGFVSKLDCLANSQYFNGNAYQPGRLLYNNADLQDMGKSSQLLNRQQASVALIERLHETGIFDERSSQRRSCGADHSEPYPYAKTQSGALQLDKMPWQHKNSAKSYFLGGIFGILVGASII